MTNENWLTEDQYFQLVNNMPPPEAGIGNFEVSNTDNGFEIDAFGVRLNDKDDFVTVGLVLLFAFAFYLGKKLIDLVFDILFNRWKRND